jgi:hypothetical protein
MLLCFTQVVHNGLLSGGGIADYMSGELGNAPMPSDVNQFAARFFFDIFFFIIVLVILLNVIFGIIIDQFGELRDEEVAKNEARTGNCFICGMKAGIFDDHYQRTEMKPNGFKVRGPPAFTCLFQPAAVMQSRAPCDAPTHPPPPLTPPPRIHTGTHHK